MSKLQTYNYESIMEQLNKIETTDQTHQAAISDILYGLENEHRMHWIDDALSEDGLPSTETIFNHYNINPY